MQVGTDWYLIDTGTFSSFSERGEVTIDGLRFELPLKEVRGMDASILSEHVKVRVNGLLGNDVLDHFDHIWDLPSGTVTIGPPNSLLQSGARVHLRREAGKLTALIPGPDGVMRVQSMETTHGLVGVCAWIEHRPHPMIFDTGAAISYFDYPDRERFPAGEDYVDFYPNIGPFITDTRIIPTMLGGESFQLRCGSLKPVFQHVAHTGIVGNEIMHGRQVGYFPQRKQMVLGASP
jgi:hypothetical protein